MSFWNRIIGAGTKDDAEGGLPVGGGSNHDKQRQRQEQIVRQTERNEGPTPTAADLPPPRSTQNVHSTSLAQSNNSNHSRSSNNHNNNHQQPLSPKNGPPPIMSSYYSPGNQQQRIKTAAGAPVIPRHSPLRVPTPLATPSSPVPIPGPPQGIHIFTPVTPTASHEEVSEEPDFLHDGDKQQESDVNEPVSDNHVETQPLPPPLPDDYLNDDFLLQDKEEEERHDAVPEEQSQEEATVAVTAEASPFYPTYQSPKTMTPPQSPGKGHHIRTPEKSGALEFQTSPHKRRTVVPTVHTKTPSRSAKSTSLVVHTPSGSPVSRSGRKKKSGPMSTDLVLLQQQETQLALFTPKSNSRFVFVSDEKTVPSELKKLGEATMRRRHLFQTRVHELELQLSSLTAKLAHESMDREAAMSEILPAHVYHPLEIAAERLLVEQDMARRPQLVPSSSETEQDVSPSNETADVKEASGVAKPSLMDLEQRLSKLDSQMTTHIHRTMFDTKREKLEAVQDQLLHEIGPELHLEASKADKREGSMNRRWESLAGILARRYLEESSTRKASLAFVEKEILGVLNQQQADDIVALFTLRELRAKLEQERLVRLAEDKRVLEIIEERAVTLQRLLLETLSDPIN